MGLSLDWDSHSTWGLENPQPSRAVHAGVSVSFRSYFGIKRKGGNLQFPGRFLIRTPGILEGMP